MTPFVLPRHLSRALALLLLLGAVLGGYLLFVHPWAVAYPEALAEQRVTRERVVRFRELAAQAESIRAQAAATRSAIVSSGAFIEGASDALAAASMQNSLDAAVEAAGGDLRSVRSRPSQTEDGMVRLRLRVQLSTDIHGLKRLLYRLETEMPLLFVESLEVRARIARSSAKSDRLSVAPDFLVDLSVFGYRLGETA